MSLPTPIGRQKEVLCLPAEGHHVVLGTAGSGKTTIAILRAAFLANPKTHHAGKTLLVTFNRMLVTYLQHLRDARMADVVVENYHTFARGYLRSRGRALDYVICNDNQRLRFIEDAVDTLCSKDGSALLKQPPEFFAEALRWISQNGITSLEDYGKAERAVKLEPFDRRSREIIWKVYELYLEIRGQAGKAFDWHDLALAVSNEFETDRTPRLYKHVVIDEGQDFSPEMIRSLAAAVPRDGSVTLFGDVAQQIYGHRISWRSAGLNISKVWEFRENYRNSRQIARLGLAISRMPFFRGIPDIVEPVEPKADGPLPTIVECPSLDAEIKFFMRQAREASRTASVAVLMRTRADEGLITALLPRGSVRLHRNLRVWNPGPGVMYGTYHSAKGLEFDVVILPFCSAESLPDPELITAHGFEDASSRDGRLLYVGVTRAKSRLIISYTGKVTPLLPNDAGLYQRLKV